MKTALLLAAVFLPVAAAAAQQVIEPQVNEPQVTSSASTPQDQPDPGRDVVNDPTSLTGRGGPALRANRTFQETIGTQIYTPIGTSIGTQMGVPH